MTILLDIDGVLETTPPWQRPEIHEDGFMKLNEKAVLQIVRLITTTKASIVLTSTHRINYTIEEWKRIFKTRGISPTDISKINDVTSLSKMSNRATEIMEWVKQHGNKHFVIIDDDPSLNSLPLEIKEKCVITKPLVGLNEASANKALSILYHNDTAT